MQTFTKFTYILGLSVLGLATVSCDTTGHPEFTEEMRTLRAVSANTLIHEDFMGSDPFNQVHKQFGTDHAFKVVEDPRNRSNKSGRFELRYGDPITSNGIRSEVLFPAQDHRERWYSYSLYIPSVGFDKDSNNDIITQWHQSGGGSPATTVRILNDRFLVKSGNTKESRKDYDLGVVKRDTWHQFVFHIIHSPNSDGLLEVWHNGEKVLTQKGGNMYDLALPRWKLGIYKASWASRTTDTDRRILFFDNINLANERSDLADFINEPIMETEEKATTTEPSTDTSNSESTSEESTSTDKENEEEEKTTETEETVEQPKGNSKNNRPDRISNKHWNK
jgi:hypothetical protein